MRFFKTNAEALGAIAAVLTALAALAALVLVPLQLAAADRIQRSQTAREIYREFLNLTVQKPELATADLCALQSPKDRAAYEAYVDFLLYTAEQVLEAEPGWEQPMQAHLSDHLPLLCARGDEPFDPALTDLLSDLRDAGCASVPPCTAG